MSPRSLRLSGVVLAFGSSVAQATVMSGLEIKGRGRVYGNGGGTVLVAADPYQRVSAGQPSASGIVDRPALHGFAESNKSFLKARASVVPSEYAAIDPSANPFELGMTATFYDRLTVTGPASGNPVMTLIFEFRGSLTRQLPNGSNSNASASLAAYNYNETTDAQQFLALTSVDVASNGGVSLPVNQIVSLDIPVPVGTFTYSVSLAASAYSLFGGGSAASDFSSTASLSAVSFAGITASQVQSGLGINYASFVVPEPTTLTAIAGVALLALRRCRLSATTVR